MKTISEVSRLTRISIRTLQYYDEIELLKPSRLTPSGHRLYDEEALQKLQQILFFKELDFKLKEIQHILQRPESEKTFIFRKQKELLLLRRDRMDKLIRLLERLEKGESCMSFEEFKLTEYLEALVNFKNGNEDDIMKHWGSLKNFDLMIQKIEEDEPHVARLAIEEFGSVEKYTEAMKYNMEHFSEIMEQELSGRTGELLQESEALYGKLTADIKRAVSEEAVQNIVREIVRFTEKNASKDGLGKVFWDSILENYSNDFIRAVTDSKYGNGASEYIALALKYYMIGNTEENHGN